MRSSRLKSHIFRCVGLSLLNFYRAIQKIRNNKRPLVAGTSEGDQLDRIFRLLGTPTQADYPGVVDLPEYHPSNLPIYPPPPNGYAGLVPTLDANGVDLLSKMLQYDPSRRITAEEALKHPFFYDGAGGMPGLA